MVKKVKRKTTFVRVVEYIVNIIVYPIIIISFFSSFFMLVARSNNLVSPIFGKTFVRVLSNSMSEYCPEAERHFVKGDIAVVQTKNVTYQVGDIIAFYYHHDDEDNAQLFNLTQIETKQVEKLDQNGNVVTDENGQTVYVENRYSPVRDDNGEVVFNTELYNSIINASVGEEFYYEEYKKYYQKTQAPEDRDTVEEVIEANTPVYFHQIVQIKIDASGTIFYVTKGTANSATDGYAIREDFVAGKYVSTPDWLASLINFCASTEGMLLLVVFPISIVVLVELLSVIEQINNLLLEKRVINREVPFDTKECAKASIGLEMRESDKIYLYDVMPGEFKLDVYNFLWGCLEESQNKKQQKIYATSKLATNVYDENNLEPYYSTWSDMFKSKRMKKQIAQAQVKAENDRYADVLNKEYQNYRDGENPYDFMDADEILKKEELAKEEDKFAHQKNIYDVKQGEKLKKSIDDKLEEINEKQTKLKTSSAKHKKPPKKPLQKTVEKANNQNADKKINNNAKVETKKMPPKKVDVNKESTAKKQPPKKIPPKNKATWLYFFAIF